MKHLLLTTILLLITMGSSHANLFNDVFQATQGAFGKSSSSNNNQSYTSNVTTSSAGGTYTTSELAGMDCAALAVSAATARREIKELQMQADTYDKLLDQHKAEVASNQTNKVIGGLMRWGSELMSKGRNAEYAETVSDIGTRLSTNATEEQLNNMNPDQILHMYKQRQADLENIQIYQSSKKCRSW